jgi:hypothetical protein
MEGCGSKRVVLLLLLLPLHHSLSLFIQVPLQECVPVTLCLKRLFGCIIIDVDYYIIITELLDTFFSMQWKQITIPEISLNT